eukprot:GFKZ01015966.1.p2 GENE.GFKZ01015966.1~~GFKZ01015966.1.p2  ORF type:complete len:126 (-),score=5.82 GFKZ01015966.1:323-700(-)
MNISSQPPHKLSTSSSSAHTPTPSVTSPTAEYPSSAAPHARSTTTTGPACRFEGIELRPLAVDVYNQIDISRLQLLQDFANFTAPRRDKPPFSDFCALQTRISAFVLQYTAVMVIHRLICGLTSH